MEHSTDPAVLAADLANFESSRIVPYTGVPADDTPALERSRIQSEPLSFEELAAAKAWDEWPPHLAADRAADTEDAADAGETE